MTPYEALAQLATLPDYGLPPEGHIWIYFLHAQSLEPPLLKIGCSRQPRDRLITIQQHCPFPLMLVELVCAPDHAERALHARFKHLRYFGEWFYAEPELLEFVATLPEGFANPPQRPVKARAATRLSTPKVTPGETPRRRVCEPRLKKPPTKTLAERKAERRRLTGSDAQVARARSRAGNKQAWAIARARRPQNAEEKQDIADYLERNPPRYY